MTMSQELDTFNHVRRLHVSIWGKIMGNTVFATIYLCWLLSLEQFDAICSLALDPSPIVSRN